MKNADAQHFLFIFIFLNQHEKVKTFNLNFDASVALMHSSLKG